MRSSLQIVVKILRALGIVLITFFSIEIIFRRWVNHQIPSQVPAWLVYTLLAVNGLLLVSVARRGLLSKASGGDGGVDQKGKKLLH